MTLPDRRIAVGLFVLAFVTYAWFFGGGGWNQNAHFDLTRALVERQTFHIDGYRVNTGDISWSPDAHAYSNKPPGLPFLAAIPYAAIYAVERTMGVSVDDWLVMTVNVYLLTLLLCAVPGALIPAVLYRYVRSTRGAAGFSQPEPFASVLMALAVAFGTIVFPYSTMLFSVVPAAFFLLLAFVWLDERPLLAGIAAGIAGMCYYPCILGAGVLAIGAWVRSRRLPLRFITGGLPFGILLAYYHTICFGAPWRTSLEVAQNFTERGLFLGLFRNHPTGAALWGLTFSEYRGLFFVSPVLLVAFVGAFQLIRRRMLRRELAMIGAISLIFLLLMASFNGWEAGASFGARHILQIVPLLAIPIAFVRGRLLLGATLVLALASFAMHLVATAVDPMPAGGIRYPMRDYYLPVFRSGHIPPATLQAMGVNDGHVGKTSINPQAVDELIPYWVHRRGSRESLWAAFNLGEFAFGAGNRTSVLPIALWILLGSGLLLRSAGTAAVSGGWSGGVPRRRPAGETPAPQPARTPAVP